MAFVDIIRKIPTKQRKYLRRFFYKSINLGFGYRPEEGLNSLKQKINVYSFFYPTKMKMYTKEIDFLKKYSDSNSPYSYIFPYSFASSYNFHDIEVYKDNNNGLFYVLHNRKRLYYSKAYKSENAVKIGYNCTLIEQDKTSPHRYLNDSFKIEKGDVVIDVGAAEGNFALDSIENISKLYIFEANPDWIEALKATFSPWKEKVHIFNKYVSSVNSGDHITLDSILKENVVNCIKIDVEGAEMSILKGSNVVLNNPNIKLFICTYHLHDDFKKIEQILIEKNFDCSASDNFMLFTLGKLKPPYFRRGLVRAKKNI